MKPSAGSCSGPRHAQDVAFASSNETVSLRQRPKDSHVSPVGRAGTRMQRKQPEGPLYPSSLQWRVAGCLHLWGGWTGGCGVRGGTGQLQASRFKSPLSRPSPIPASLLCHLGLSATSLGPVLVSSSSAAGLWPSSSCDPRGWQPVSLPCLEHARLPPFPAGKKPQFSLVFQAFSDVAPIFPGGPL